MTSAAEVIAAPYFSLSNAAWIPCAVTWDLEAASFGGSRGFESYRVAIEASRFLGSANSNRGAVGAVVPPPRRAIPADPGGSFAA